jgi:NAD(P)H-flavin reductase
MVPLRAMIKDLISTGEIHDRDVTLLFGVRSQEDLFGTAELERWTREFPRFRFVPTLSRPEPGWTGAVGRVTAHLTEWDFPVQDMQIYLCGNGAMISDAIAIMEGKGLGKRTRRIVFEKYFD